MWSSYISVILVKVLFRFVCLFDFASIYDSCLEVIFILNLCKCYLLKNAFYFYYYFFFFKKGKPRKKLCEIIF